MPSLITPGSQVVVRDEEWLVKAVAETEADGQRVEVIGVSEFVRDTESIFFTEIDNVITLDPASTRLVADDSPGFRRSRLWLEALLRRTPLPLDDSRIAVGHRALLDDLSYQRRPAQRALSNLRPRVLVADAVGLGKTLEIGMILAELIKRGRGERILVVTPRAVLEQFQRELWTRFAIPLVRLDSAGIQKVRQKLPASRNPFSYYRRAIISIDTLKNPQRYKHHLSGQRWDVVVIDECHNLINRGTQNNELARLLAKQADALILASATPHNGKAESFAELVNLLDPTAIADPSAYTERDIAHLYVHRHRGSDDVRLEVAHNWKERGPTDVRPVTPTPAEEAVLDELDAVWLRPADGRSPVSGAGRSLLPWTLFKAFLSSTPALRASIAARTQTLGKPGAKTDAAEASRERDALARLDELAAKAEQDGSSKLTALVDHLRGIGVGPTSPTRAVLFSERTDTLDWLRDELPARLGLAPSAVAVMHSKVTDTALQDAIEDFALAGGATRLLLAGDMASEGINLHRQCHDLIHFDLPWSLIRIQQRNGRIDRYMQLRTPRIAALAMAPDNPSVLSDIRVLTRLLAKEHAAYTVLGDAGSLLGVHDEEVEESRVLDVLRHRDDIDVLVPDPSPAALDPFEALLTLGGSHSGEPPAPVMTERTLFDSDAAYLTEALAAVSDVPPEEAYDLRLEPDTGLLAFAPPDDLKRRLDDLPADYLAERAVTTRMKVTTSRRFADASMAAARESDTMEWPEVQFLAPLHPVLEWVTDRALAQLGRNETPVLAGSVESPVFLTQGVWCNERGQPVIVHWGAVSGLPDAPSVRDADGVLDAAGIRAGTTNTGRSRAWIDTLQPLVPAALAAADAHLSALRAERDERIASRIAEQKARLGQWADRAEQLTLALQSAHGQERARQRIAGERSEAGRLIDFPDAERRPADPGRGGHRPASSRRTGAADDPLKPDHASPDPVGATNVRLDPQRRRVPLGPLAGLGLPRAAADTVEGVG